MGVVPGRSADGLWLSALQSDDTEGCRSISLYLL